MFLFFFLYKFTPPRKLQHKNLVRLLGVILHKGLHIVTELMMKVESTHHQPVVKYIINTLNELHVTICSNLHVIITFLLDKCERIVRRRERLDLPRLSRLTMQASG